MKAVVVGTRGFKRRTRQGEVYTDMALQLINGPVELVGPDFDY